MDATCASLKAQTVLRGVLAPCYGVDNKVPQLYSAQSVPLDYAFANHR